MTDLVGTCPKSFWEEWIAEGDPAGSLQSGEEWGWYTGHSHATLIRPGDRFYVVAWGKLRGWAPVTRVERTDTGWIICRRGNAVACTVGGRIPGFRGLRLRWWQREEEIPFPNWKTAGVGEMVQPLAEVDRERLLL